MINREELIQKVKTKQNERSNSLLYKISLPIRVLIKGVMMTLSTVTLSFPLFIGLSFRKIFTGKDIFKQEVISSGTGNPLKLHLFNVEGWLGSRFSLFLSVLRGKLDLVGVSFKEHSSSDSNVKLPSAKPGIFNLWFIRESTKIAHEGVIDTDLEYLANRSLKSDFFIILKTFPAIAYRSKGGEYHKILNLFNLDFLNITMEKAVDLIDTTVTSKEKRKFFFVNPDCMNKLYVDKNYYNILQNGDYIFPDGIGISIACNMLGTPLLENVNGTDMLPFICELSQKKGHGIFLFGSKPGITEKMKKKLEEKYTNINIVGTRNGFFDWEKDTPQIIDEINKSKADILLVAFGVPLQEKWITENSEALNPHVQMGVGGLFDFYSGTMNRAPKWMREVGMEWLYRLKKEPKRMWRRYIIGNPLFLYRVFKWKRKNR